MPQADKPLILLLGRLTRFVHDRIVADYETVSASKETLDAVVAEHGDRVRGVATFGHMPVDDALMARLPKLETVANYGVGYDTVDAVAAARRGVIVTHTPDVLTEEVADVAMGLLINTARQLPAAERYLREGRWVSEGPFALSPTTLRGRTLGIVGLGRIGKAIAARAEAFGLKIAYHGRRRQADVAYPYHDSLAGLAEAVDTLMLVVPGGEETRHMVGADVLAALGRDGLLINIGRGSTVDETALAKALQDGVIAGAGLDVFEDEPRVPQALLDAPNTVLLPHVGSASVATREAMGQRLLDNLSGWFLNGQPPSPVPETPLS